MTVIAVLVGFVLVPWQASRLRDPAMGDGTSCPRCGEAVDERDRYCHRCGRTLTDEDDRDHGDGSSPDDDVGEK